MVLPFVVTWNVREYWGGRDWVGPGVPMPTGRVVVTGAGVVGMTVGASGNNKEQDKKRESKA